jgi:uncharacterized membrane protein YbhN (UPF0104 family)
MRMSRAVLAAIVITALYLSALLWADSRNQVFSQLPRVAGTLPALMVMSLLSYVLRYARWHWLLLRTHSAGPLLDGWLAYLAGFAFTATPGKVGELVRIRYFHAQGVAPARVLAAFVFERALDLIVVGLIATLSIHEPRLLGIALGFVATVLAVVVLLASKPALLGRASAHLRRRGFHGLARTTRTLQTGLLGCRAWLNPLDISVALLLGGLAWSLTALSFVWLLMQLDIALPAGLAFSLYPTAMLAGAASMLPAGIGATEVTLVALLATHAVPLGTATLAAVGIRFSSLWFAVCCGFLAMARLEFTARNRSILRTK